MRANDPLRSTQIAKSWFESPYPTFKRLALFAASQENCILPEQWVDWLLAEDAKWLWSTDTKREMFRLLVNQGHHMDDSIRGRLEAAILAGPPREMYRDDLNGEQWQECVAHSVWLRLAKMSLSGIKLGAEAAAYLEKVSDQYPRWKVSPREQDEFSYWMSGSGDPDFEESRIIAIAPRTRKELKNWLSTPVPEKRYLYEDNWRDVCRTRFFHSLSALCDLTKENEWPIGRWNEALQTWAEESMVSRSWRYAAGLVQRMPDMILRETVNNLAWWIEASSRNSEIHKEIFLDLICRILSLPLEARTSLSHEDNSINDPITEAINHPIGQGTQALVNLWFMQRPNDSVMLPSDLQPIFTNLCDLKTERFRHARLVLAAHLIAFFRVDRQWTKKNLLPLFDWRSNPIEAKTAWAGFLWSPRIYQPLMEAFKEQFLKT